MAAKQSGNTATGMLEQWACKLIDFSTEYDSYGWSASSTLDRPKVYPRYGDNSGAWAQETCDDKEFIELGFETPVYVSAIHIYETWNSGGVKRVSVRSSKGSWVTVWETDKVKHIKESRIFSPQIQSPGYKTKAVRLDIDCTVSGSWVEIDAVQLVGRKLKVDPPPPLSAALEDFAKLVNDKETSDVVFRAGDTDIYAHRAILSVRSPKLKDMLVLSGQGGVIPVEDITYDTFLGVLHYIYSGSIPCTQFGPESLVSVWRAATKLKLDGLGAYCVTMIDDGMNTSNVIDVFVNASDKDPVSEDIREVCLEFLASNLASVSHTSQFKDLPQALMLEIVQLSTSRLVLE